MEVSSNVFVWPTVWKFTRQKTEKSNKFSHLRTLEWSPILCLLLAPFWSVSTPETNIWHSAVTLIPCVHMCQKGVANNHILFSTANVFGIWLVCFLHVSMGSVQRVCQSFGHWKRCWWQQWEWTKTRQLQAVKPDQWAEICSVELCNCRISDNSQWVGRYELHLSHLIHFWYKKYWWADWNIYLACTAEMLATFYWCSCDSLSPVH